MKIIKSTLFVVFASILGVSAANAFPANDSINIYWEGPAEEAHGSQFLNKLKRGLINGAQIPSSFEMACYGCISETTGRPRTEYVRPHVRSNGTYVNGYWRS
jgi:hypothetical protein